MDCRRVKITNRHGSKSGNSIDRFCERPKSQWTMAGPDTGR